MMNSLLLHKRNIARKFNRAVDSYDGIADLQFNSGKQLIDRLAELKLKPSRLLDLGVGTGQLTKNLHGLYPRAQLVGLDLAKGMLTRCMQRFPQRSLFLLGADFEALPFVPQSFPLIYSNMSLQWSFDLPATLYSITQCLMSKGTFAFTMLVDETLHELAKCFIHIVGVQRVNPFYSSEEVLRALQHAGVEVVFAKKTSQQKKFGGFTELLRFLRETGASYSRHKKVFTSRNTWRALQTYYAETFGEGNTLPATFSILTVIARNK